MQIYGLYAQYKILFIHYIIFKKLKFNLISIMIAKNYILYYKIIAKVGKLLESTVMIEFETSLLSAY